MTLADWEGRLTFWVSSAAPEDPPVKVDLTRFVRDELQAISIASGRQDNNQPSQPGQASLLLDNRELLDDPVAPNAGRFTYGNSTSPFASWWAPGRLCGMSERIGSFDIDLFTGFLQVPVENTTTDGLEMSVPISMVDDLGRLQSGDTFRSTLAAHIVGSSRNDCLQRYWPLNDTAEPFSDVMVAAPIRIVRPDPLMAIVATYAGGPPLPGDDITTLGLTFNTSYFATPVVEATTFPGSVPLAAGEVATAVGWLRPDSLIGEALGLIQTNDVITSPTQTPLSINIVDALGAHWGAIFDSGTVEAPLGTHSSYGRWSIVAVRFGFSPNVLELWVDDKSYTTTFPGTYTFSNVYGPFVAAYGSLAHLQWYQGDPADFTFTDFTLQRQVGLAGLGGQSTGDRVRSIAQYAGIASSRLSRVDDGAAVMSIARLAGKTPLEAMQEAETTEQGLLSVDGSGNLVFADRLRRYNI